MSRSFVSASRKNWMLYLMSYNFHRRRRCFISRVDALFRFAIDAYSIIQKRSSRRATNTFKLLINSTDNSRSFELHFENDILFESSSICANQMRSLMSRIRHARQAIYMILIDDARYKRQTSDLYITRLANCFCLTSIWLFAQRRSTSSCLSSMYVWLTYI